MGKVILFGAGLYGRTFVEKNRDFIHDNFLFCDSDSERRGEILRGLEIISFEDLKRLYENGEIARIVITAAKVDEVLGQCLQNEIDGKYIYCYEMETNAIKPAREAYSIPVFSQDGEETCLREFFGNKKDGFYVDVGAYHPFRFSNTAWAYERGWTGINIEPNAEGHKRFLWARERDININCGISEEEGFLTYFQLDEGACNTFYREEISRSLSIKKEEKVATKRLDSVFSEYQVEQIDFMDIDVEGAEMAVLHSNNWDLYRPMIVLIEQKMSMEEVLRSEVFTFMKEKGYQAVSKFDRTVIYKKIGGK